jgi:prevent-host-death family protein
VKTDGADERKDEEQKRRFRGHVRVGLTAGTKSATIVAMTTEALRTVRDHFSDVVDRVESQHERVMVTRNGKPAAVIISPDDLAELEERLEILSDPDAMAEIREGRDAYARGDVISGVDAVRALRK